MFFDWNGNGRKDDSFDNMMDFMMLSEMEKDEKKRKDSNPEKSTGSCLLALVLLPAALVAILLHIK